MVDPLRTGQGPHTLPLRETTTGESRGAERSGGVDARGALGDDGPGNLPPLRGAGGAPGSGPPDLPPGNPPPDLSPTLKRLSDFSETFNVQELMVEALKMNQQLKKAARVDREAHLDASEALAKSAAADIRSAAMWSLGTTIASSALQIGGAAVSAIGAAKAQAQMDKMMETAPPKTPELQTPQSNVSQPKLQGGKTSDTEIELKEIKPQTKLPETEVKQPEVRTENPLDRMGQFERAKFSAQAIASKWQAASTGVTEGGKIVGSAFNVVGQGFEAKKVEKQAESQRESSRAENEADFKQAAEKAIATVLDKMAEIARAQDQATRSISRIGG